jgi:hypothetical protein
MKKVPVETKRRETTNSLVGILLLITPAFLGLVFCSLNAAGSKLLCATSGCDIYAGYQFAGISFYVWGAAGFALLLALGFLSYWRPVFRVWLVFCLCLGMLLDTGFLVWQVLFWPCTSCLVVAILLALFAGGFLWVTPRGDSDSKTIKFALLLWGITFIPAATGAGKELLLQPWVLSGPENAPISVIFSPTCPACQQTVQEIFSVPELKEQAVFIPIAKNEEDVNRIARFQEDKTTDLMQLFAPLDGSHQVSAGLRLRWQLARNKMILARSGEMSVPQVKAPKLFFTKRVEYPAVQDSSSYQSIIFGSEPIELEEGCSAASNNEQSCE